MVEVAIGGTLLVRYVNIGLDLTSPAPDGDIKV